MRIYKCLEDVDSIITRLQEGKIYPSDVTQDVVAVTPPSAS